MPALVKPREATTGASKFAAELLEKQRLKSAAFTRAFYATHQQGHFEAFKMTRTRVPKPKQYMGAKFKKLFEDASALREICWDPLGVIAGLLGRNDGSPSSGLLPRG